ncbi:FAD-binding domain-containing protein [Tuber magnatum]|uniref:FAD-binding domain-containing protein n=1 Tax=Tuber magnatum TaxID=42249 RepID=A0A317SRI7_9PEZI|nr:FAD-binding domain-containing protein [Tuber magnatum]
MFLKPPLTILFLLLWPQTFQTAGSRNPEDIVLRLSAAKTACLDPRITDLEYNYISTEPESEYLRKINLYSLPPSLQPISRKNTNGPTQRPSLLGNPAMYLLQAITAVGAPFAVRSGGHSPNPGWSNIDKGAPVELSRINEITYGPASTNVVIGTGNRLGAVYATLEVFGRTAVGARVSPVGVGGFLLGGGLSHISNEYRFGCDNVVQYEAVLANSTRTIVNANTNSRSELFWALKPAHTTVITLFTLKTIPISKIWGGVITYNATQAIAVMDAIHTYHTKHISDLKSAISVQFILSAGVVLGTLM